MYLFSDFVLAMAMRCDGVFLALLLRFPLCCRKHFQYDKKRLIDQKFAYDDVKIAMLE
jgi:hypothetical protein